MSQPWPRLLAMGTLSLAVHMVIIGWFAHWTPPVPGAPSAAPPAPLSIRLQQGHRGPAPAPFVPAPATPAPAPAPLPQPVAAALPATATPPALATPAPPAPALPAIAVQDTSPTSPEPGGAAPGWMPGSYRSRLPDSARLSYAVVRAGQPAGSATLDWRTDTSSYALKVDGILGNFVVTGGASDSGVAPAAVTEQRADGGTVDTTFDGRNIVIDGRTYRNSPGSQDRASLLMQLTGMGLVEPDQIRGVIAIHVSGPREPEIMRFEVVDAEELATPLGAIATRHLVQKVRVGEARLEVWLAPAHGWMPVQLRMTAPDGTVSTQTVTHIEPR